MRSWKHNYEEMFEQETETGVSTFTDANIFMLVIFCAELQIKQQRPVTVSLHQVFLMQHFRTSSSLDLVMFNEEESLRAAIIKHSIKRCTLFVDCQQLSDVRRIRWGGYHNFSFNHHSFLPSRSKAWTLHTQYKSSAPSKRQPPQFFFFNQLPS